MVGGTPMSREVQGDDDSRDENEGGVIGLLSSIGDFLDATSKIIDTFSESKTFAKMVKKHKEKMSHKIEK